MTFNSAVEQRQFSVGSRFQKGAFDPLKHARTSLPILVVPEFLKTLV